MPGRPEAAKGVLPAELRRGVTEGAPLSAELDARGWRRGYPSHQPRRRRFAKRQVFDLVSSSAVREGVCLVFLWP